VAACISGGQSVKRTLNYLGLLHGIFDFAIRRGWASANPVKLVEKPRNRDEDADIRFLDKTARRIRVRLNFVRGRTGTPKSKRSSRSVPLADILGGELDLLHRRSAFDDHEDLVFAHPHTGKPIDRSRLLKRYKQAL